MIRANGKGVGRCVIDLAIAWIRATPHITTEQQVRAQAMIARDNSEIIWRTVTRRHFKEYQDAVVAEWERSR